MARRLLKRAVENTRLYRPASKYGATVHVFGAVTYTTKLPLVFFGRDTRINAAIYCQRVLRECIGPWLEANDAERNLILQEVNDFAIFVRAIISGWCTWALGTDVAIVQGRSAHFQY